MSVVEMEWTRRRALDLISMYKAEECLWNVRSPSHKNSQMKQDALARLAAAFETNSVAIDRKLKSLVVQYRREIRKVEESKRANSDPEAVYKPTWFGYAALRFLDDMHEPKDTGDTMDIAISEDFGVEIPSSSSTPKRQKTVCRISRGASDSSTKHGETDECAAYAAYMATKLRGLEPLQRAITINRINQVIFEAELQKYGVES